MKEIQLTKEILFDCFNNYYSYKKVYEDEYQRLFIFINQNKYEIFGKVFLYVKEDNNIYEYNFQKNNNINNTNEKYTMKIYYWDEFIFETEPIFNMPININLHPHAN